MSRQVSVLKGLIFTGEETEKQAITVNVIREQQGASVAVGAQRRNLPRIVARGCQKSRSQFSLA